MFVRKVWPGLIGGRGASLSIALVLIVGIVGWVGFQIRNDLLTNTDELLTAERSREMLLLGRGTVHDNFLISVAKPPLQYWLTSFSLPRFEKRELAVRMWPLVYGALTAAALGLLACQIKPDRSSLVPLSVGFLLSCPFFLMEVSRADLDTGLTFYTTLAIGFGQRARKHPEWWLGVAVACWLGALQKTPIILLVWLIILFVRLICDRASLRSRWIIASLILGFILLSVWPLVQRLGYHVSLRKISRLTEAIELVGPNRLGVRPYFQIPMKMVQIWPCGLFALSAVIAVFFMARRNNQTAVAEIAVLPLTIIGLAILLGFRSTRYVLPIIPCLCLLLGLLTLWMWDSGRALYRFACFLLLMLSAVGLPVTRYVIHHRRGLGIILSLTGPKATPEMIEQRVRDAADQKLVAKQIGALQTPGTGIVIVGAYRGLLPPHFYLFYGNIPRRIAYYLVGEFPDSLEVAPAVGACAVRDLPVVERKYSKIVVRGVHGNFVCWAAPSGP